MEGLVWITGCAYLIFGCFYYTACINKIASFIIRMNGMTLVNAVSLLILMLALVVGWPYLLWLDIKDSWK